ncbi:MAG: hypothetical protein M4579_005400 [Chaenotheca gracillima]|nr:MAG: hypothetical protein M4579_005400 [Chaenotheca gracillima]
MDAIKTASGKVPEALALAPKWFGAYGDFVTKNASSVSQIESALRSLTYIIPGTKTLQWWHESNAVMLVGYILTMIDLQVASESRSWHQNLVSFHDGFSTVLYALTKADILQVHSSVQLLSIYHDSLLARALDRLPKTQKPPPSAHNRYTRFWSQKSTQYRRIALALQVLQYTELLIEMASKRRGERTRWRVVVLLESVKAVCRLWLLRLTNSRPLVSPPLPEREVDPAKLEEEKQQEEQVPEDSEEFFEQESREKQSPDSSSTGWSMPRTGFTLPTLPASSDVTNYLLSKVLTADDLKPPKALLHRVSGAGQIAEILYILRPVIYAMAMQRWAMSVSDAPGAARKSSWRPWLLGFSIEYGARQLAKKDFRERVAGGLKGLTGLEREELRRRGWAMGWWTLRGAFYENVTRPYLVSITSKMAKKPLLDLIGGVIGDYEYLWGEYYFPTATL